MPYWLRSVVYNGMNSDLGGKSGPLNKSEFFDRIYDAHLPNSIFTIDVATGVFEVIHSESTWLGHIQFSPTTRKP